MNENNANEITRQITMSIARDLLKKGIITAEEYNKFDTIMTEKYSETLS